MAKAARVVFGTVAAMVVAAPVVAQDTTSAWAFTAELTAVWTAGNSQSNTIGFGATIERSFAHSGFKIEGGGLQSRSSLTTRTAVGTTSSFTLQETKVTEKTAEWYFARGRYDHQLGDKTFVFGGVDWMRNQFSGIDSRLLFAAGAGATLANSDRVSFKTDVSATYTFQEDVVENPFVKTNFPGLRAAYDLSWQLTASTKLMNQLFGDLNLVDTDDIRVDFTIGLPISISSVLAFKPSWQLLWRNQPSLTEVPLENPAGTPTGETVLVPLEKLDSFLRLALVLDF